MKIDTTDRWNLWDKVNSNQCHRYIKDVVPELKNKQIKTDSVDFSKEGMAALRAKVQSMPGHIDVEEMKKTFEILPKLRMNPEDDFYWAMRNEMHISLDELKKSKGSYTSEEFMAICTDAYTNQYNALQKAYAEGGRDIYIDDGIDENGKWQYHKVSQEEDFAFLEKAFKRITNSLIFRSRAWSE